MGGGSWTTSAFVDYSHSKNRGVDARGATMTKMMSASQVYEQRRLHPNLDPLNVVRECCDSEEHPNTIPVILALDVTGSMGQTAVEVASELNTIMTELYKDVTDVEFLIMGIGDLSYDDAPIQATQFESDIRIAEQLDNLYFEFGGGGNSWESYTAAWAFGLNQTKLDCWNRGKKGIIITMGDEELNPYLPRTAYDRITGCIDKFQSKGDIETQKLYREVKEKFNIYHINVDHRAYCQPTLETFKNTLGEDHVITCKVNSIAQTIASIVRNAANSTNESFIADTPVNSNAGAGNDGEDFISW